MLTAEERLLGETSADEGVEDAPDPAPSGPEEKDSDEDGEATSPSPASATTSQTWVPAYKQGQGTGYCYMEPAPYRVCKWSGQDPALTCGLRFYATFFLHDFVCWLGPQAAVFVLQVTWPIAVCHTCPAVLAGSPGHAPTSARASGSSGQDSR